MSCCLSWTSFRRASQYWRDIAPAVSQGSRLSPVLDVASMESQLQSSMNKSPFCLIIHRLGCVVEDNLTAVES